MGVRICVSSESPVCWCCWSWPRFGNPALEKSSQRGEWRAEGGLLDELASPSYSLRLPFFKESCTSGRQHSDRWSYLGPKTASSLGVFSFWVFSSQPTSIHLVWFSFFFFLIWLVLLSCTEATRSLGWLILRRLPLLDPQSTHYLTLPSLGF